MGEILLLWTKFDPLTTNIFWIYNFSDLNIIKFCSEKKTCSAIKKSQYIMGMIVATYLG